MTEEVKNKIKILHGQVVSDKMTGTVVVSVNRVKTHPVYKKKFTVSRKYKVNDPENSCKVGDSVDIVPTRPVSKDKHYMILRKI